MSNSINKFARLMRNKLHDVEHRLEALKTASEAQADHTEKAIRAHIVTLEDEAHEAKKSLDQARANMVDWVDETKEVVADWKAKFDTRMLQGRADRSERYADAALVVALAGVDNAEKAMLSADVARIDADASSKS